MILTRGETSIQLTFTLDEYRQFNTAIVEFRNEVIGTFSNGIPNLGPEDREYFDTLQDDFMHTLNYIDRTIVSRTQAGIRLTFSVREYDMFGENIGLLRLDVTGFQEWYNSRGEYQKENDLENLQRLIDIFMRLLGNRIILDS